MNEMSDDRLVTDPVCAMQIKRKRVSATIVHEGKTYVFCTEASRRQFEREPHRYVGGSASE